MTLREQIAAASAKATQGVWQIAAWYRNSGTPDELCGGFIEADDSPTGVIDENWMQDSESLSRDLDLIVALVNAYRQGKLLVIEDEQEAVRRMAGAIGEYVMPECPWDAALAALEGEA